MADGMGEFASRKGIGRTRDCCICSFCLIYAENSLGNILMRRNEIKKRHRSKCTLIDCVVPCVSILMNQILFEQKFEEKKQVLKWFYSEMVLQVFQQQVMTVLEQD